jgi:hypothetical protein
VGPRAGLEAVEKRYLDLSANRTPPVQPIARCCTDRAVSAPVCFTVHTTTIANWVQGKCSTDPGISSSNVSQGMDAFFFHSVTSTAGTDIAIGRSPTEGMLQSVLRSKVNAKCT